MSASKKIGRILKLEQEFWRDLITAFKPAKPKVKVNYNFSRPFFPIVDCRSFYWQLDSSRVATAESAKSIGSLFSESRARDLHYWVGLENPVMREGDSVFILVEDQIVDNRHRPRLLVFSASKEVPRKSPNFARSMRLGLRRALGDKGARNLLAKVRREARRREAAL